MNETWNVKCPGCYSESKSHKTEADAINWLNKHQENCMSHFYCSFCKDGFERDYKAWVDYFNWRIGVDSLVWNLEKQYYHRECYEAKNKHLSFSDKQKLEDIKIDRERKRVMDEMKRKNEETESILAKLDSQNKNLDEQFAKMKVSEKEIDESSKMLIKSLESFKFENGTIVKPNQNGNIEDRIAALERTMSAVSDVFVEYQAFIVEQSK